MSISKELEQQISTHLEAAGYELVDVQSQMEHGQKVIRVFIDKPGSLNLTDCENVSRSLGDFLDKSGKVGAQSVLEVSSPGLDRVLKKEKDFVRFSGKKVKISVFAPIEGQRNFIGKIIGCSGSSVDIEDVKGKKLSFMMENIARARLEPDLDNI